jgi:hypothetical protein
MAEYRDEEAVRIPRINNDRSDLLPVPQAKVLPGLPRIGRLVDPVTGGEIRSLETFAAPDKNDGRVRRRDGESADGSGGLIIEYRPPRPPVVAGLPYPAVIHADIEDVGHPGDARCTHGPPSSVRADHAPSQILVQ